LLFHGVKFRVVLLAVTRLGWDATRLIDTVACRGISVGRFIRRDRSITIIIISTVDAHGTS
jgi:hypothetical protein